MFLDRCGVSPGDTTNSIISSLSRDHYQASSPPAPRWFSPMITAARSRQIGGDAHLAEAAACHAA
jgi:hypothetical protein